MASNREKEDKRKHTKDENRREKKGEKKGENERREKVVCLNY